MVLKNSSNVFKLRFNLVYFNKLFEVYRSHVNFFINQECFSVTGLPKDQIHLIHFRLNMSTSFALQN